MGGNDFLFQSAPDRVRNLVGYSRVYILHERVVLLLATPPLISFGRMHCMLAVTQTDTGYPGYSCINRNIYMHYSNVCALPIFKKCL